MDEVSLLGQMWRFVFFATLQFFFVAGKTVEYSNICKSKSLYKGDEYNVNFGSMGNYTCRTAFEELRNGYWRPPIPPPPESNDTGKFCYLYRNQGISVQINLALAWQLIAKKCCADEQLFCLLGYPHICANPNDFISSTGCIKQLSAIENHGLWNLQNFSCPTNASERWSWLRYSYLANSCCANKMIACPPLFSKMCKNPSDYTPVSWCTMSLAGFAGSKLYPYLKQLGTDKETASCKNIASAMLVPNLTHAGLEKPCCGNGQKRLCGEPDYSKVCFNPKRYMGDNHVIDVGHRNTTCRLFLTHFYHPILYLSGFRHWCQRKQYHTEFFKATKLCCSDGRSLCSQEGFSRMCKDPSNYRPQMEIREKKETCDNLAVIASSFQMGSKIDWKSLRSCDAVKNTLGYFLQDLKDCCGGHSLCGEPNYSNLCKSTGVYLGDTHYTNSYIVGNGTCRNVLSEDSSFFKDKSQMAFLGGGWCGAVRLSTVQQLSLVAQLCCLDRKFRCVSDYSRICINPRDYDPFGTANAPGMSVPKNRTFGPAFGSCDGSILSASKITTLPFRGIDWSTLTCNILEKKSVSVQIQPGIQKKINALEVLNMSFQKCCGGKGICKPGTNDEKSKTGKKSKNDEKRVSKFIWYGLGLCLSCFLVFGFVYCFFRRRSVLKTKEESIIRNDSTIEIAYMSLE
eukprot:g9924.t1